MYFIYREKIAGKFECSENFEIEFSENFEFSKNFFEKIFFKLSENLDNLLAQAQRYHM